MERVERVGPLETTVLALPLSESFFKALAREKSMKIKTKKQKPAKAGLKAKKGPEV